MFDRLVEDFCQFDDFCRVFCPRWEARLLTEVTGAKPRVGCIFRLERRGGV